MELYIYDRDMTLRGVIDEFATLIWSRRYWSCGDFRLLVPFTDKHIELLTQNRLIMKRGDAEAGEIRYIAVSKNAQGLEQIEAQGRFATNWIGKRALIKPIITTDNTQNILRRIVNEAIINPADTSKRIPGIFMADMPDLGSGVIEYASEPFINALLACETAAKAAKLGFRIISDPRTQRREFLVYAGRDLTADNNDGNPPCVFSQEFDNITEQEFVNSVENLRTTAYVAGEAVDGVPRAVIEVGGKAVGADRSEVFIDASDITQIVRGENGVETLLPDARYHEMLYQRGVSELEGYRESLAFSSGLNMSGNLKYRDDFDVGDRVTCVNRRWGVKINVRITEIREIYEKNQTRIEATFGESLPTLTDKIRQIAR